MENDDTNQAADGDARARHGNLGVAEPTRMSNKITRTWKHMRPHVVRQGEARRYMQIGWLRRREAQQGVGLVGEHYMRHRGSDGEVRGVHGPAAESNGGKDVHRVQYARED